MLPRASSYAELTARFRWSIPDRYNIGTDICDRQDQAATALIEVAADGSEQHWRFADIGRAAARLSNALAARGVKRGDRVGILLAQSSEAAIAHVACYRAGFIALPLFTLFGADALEFRLSDSGAKALIVEAGSLHKILECRDRLPNLETILVVGLGADDGTGVLDYAGTVAKGADSFAPVDTAAEDPAVIIYTSGTTGNPKGALHAHRVLLGHLPGVELPHDFFPAPGDRFWTPADWAWIGGLLDVLLPAWHHGVPVVAHRMAKFEPERAFDLIRRLEVRNLFLPPTALKLMRQAGAPDCRSVRTVASGGETLGRELLDWGQKVFGTAINEFYGQTECNLIVGNDNRLFPIRPGSMGRAIPGHHLAVIDADGREVPPGETGLIAVHRPDPVMFLGYWNNPKATAEKFIGDWLVTGDQGQMDADGHLWFVGRDDDIITSAGYRIGPGEVEDCLMRHPAVAMAAVVGVPDPVRTEVVKAFVVLRQDRQAGPDLAAELQGFVKQRLAAHEYPRLVEFLDALPTTATGKVIRRELRNRAAG